MLISVIPAEFQEIGNKILNKCAVQGKSRANVRFAIRVYRYASPDSIVPDGADPCEKIYNVAKCVQGTVPEVSRPRANNSPSRVADLSALLSLGLTRDRYPRGLYRAVGSSQVADTFLASNETEISFQLWFMV